MTTDEPDTQAHGSRYEDEMASSRDIRTGYLSGPGVYRLPVQYAVVDGVALFAGCIDMGTLEEVDAEAAYIRAEDRAATDSTIGGNEDQEEPEQQGVGLPPDSQFLWPQGVVPYTIAANLPNQARVTDAIAHIEDRSPIRLVQRTAANASQFPNWVEFTPHPSINSSPVGMRGGRQIIRLSPGATVGTVVHEILHSLGIYHEQSRSDRDEFIEIRWQNIQESAIHNFQIVPGAVDYYDYDYGSIMHYPRWAFATDPTQDTIVPRQAGVTIGQRNGLSFGDRLIIAKMYERFFARGYSGVWRAQTGRYGLWANATWDSFRAKWQEWSNSGLRLVDIHTRLVGNQTRYSGVFLQGSGKYGLWANSRYDAFRQKWQEWAGEGLRLVGLHIHRVGSENRYSGVWLPGTGAYGLWVNASWDSFRATWQEWAGMGLRLVDIHVHRVNGQTRYSGVWLAGSGAYGLWANATWDSFRAKWQEWAQQGLRLVDINIHQANSQNRYTGVWRAGTGGHYLWANVTWENFRAKWEQLAEQGYRLIDFEFPAPAVGLLAEADLASAAADGESMADPAVDGYGVGGVFGEERRDLLAAMASASPLTEPMEVGGLVANGGAPLPVGGPEDGQGEVFVAEGPARAGSLSAAEEAGSLGGVGDMGRSSAAAQPSESAEQEATGMGGLVAR